MRTIGGESERQTDMQKKKCRVLGANDRGGKIDAKVILAYGKGGTLNMLPVNP